MKKINAHCSRVAMSGDYETGSGRYFGGERPGALLYHVEYDDGEVWDWDTLRAANRADAIHQAQLKWPMANFRR